jgi:hypothetical protein
LLNLQVIAAQPLRIKKSQLKIKTSPVKMKPLSGLDINVTDTNPFGVLKNNNNNINSKPVIRFKDDLKSRILKYLPIITSQW